jgi:hypothetical protein
MRRCFLILGLTSALAVPLAAAPVTALAVPKSVKKLQKVVKTQGQSIAVLSTKLVNLTTTLGSVSGAVSTITASAPTVQSALTQLAAGLTALKNAVQDPITGLVGLNNARPQFGAFKADGTLIDGTGAHPPAKGPSANAPNPSAGKYIVDFGNDVSARFLSVTSFPTGGVPVVGSAVNCSASTMPCTAADTSPNHVLFLFQNSTNGAPLNPANGFEAAALSG